MRIKFIAFIFLVPAFIFAQILGPLNTAWWADDGGLTQNTELTNQLIAHWEFEQLTATPRFDSHASNTLFDVTAEVIGLGTVVGKIGEWGIRSANSSARLQSTNAVNFNVDGYNFSFNFWFRDALNLPTPHFLAGVWDISSTALQQWMIGISAASNLVFVIGRDAGSGGNITNTIPLPTSITNTYTMITATYNLGDEQSFLYINAGEPGSGGTINAREIGDLNDVFFTVLADTSGTTALHSAEVDTMSFWRNRVLTPAEVTHLYNSANGIAYPY